MPLHINGFGLFFSPIIQGVKRRMFKWSIFFVFLKSLIFALLLLYVT